MDKDLDRLHDLARGIIKQQFDRERALQAAGDALFSDSRLKKIRKVMTQLDQNHKIYADQMDNILSGGGSVQDMGDQLRSAIRGVEEYALEAFKLLQDDSVHHKVQSRTGGDTMIEAPGDRVRRVWSRLEDHFGMEFGNAFGPGGNLTADMSLSNRAHKWDERARGLEKEAGIGKEATKDTTAHRRSTAGSSKNLTPAQLADDDSLFEALKANIQQQLDDARVGGATDAPRQGLVRALTDDPMAYNPAATAEDVAASRARVAAQSAEDIVDTYRGGFGMATRGGIMRLVGLGTAGATGLGALFDAGDVKAGVEQIAEGESITDKLSGAMNVAAGGLGLASIKAPPLALPSLLFRQGAALLRYKPEEAAQPESIVPELFPRPQSVMANTPSGVAKLTEKKPRVPQLPNLR